MSFKYQSKGFSITYFHKTIKLHIMGSTSDIQKTLDEKNANKFQATKDVSLTKCPTSTGADIIASVTFQTQAIAIGEPKIIMDAHAGTSSEDEVQSSFRHFTSLPCEIRIMIWKLALHPPNGREKYNILILGAYTRPGDEGNEIYFRMRKQIYSHLQPSPQLTWMTNRFSTLLSVQSLVL